MASISENKKNGKTVSYTALTQVFASLLIFIIITCNGVEILIKFHLWS